MLATLILLCGVYVVCVVIWKKNERTQAVERHYWQVLYFLGDHGGSVRFSVLSQALGLNQNQVHGVMTRIIEDDLVISTFKGEFIYHVNGRGLDLLKENYANFEGQPWYHGPI